MTAVQAGRILILACPIHIYLCSTVHQLTRAVLLEYMVPMPKQSINEQPMVLECLFYSKYKAQDFHQTQVRQAVRNRNGSFHSLKQKLIPSRTTYQSCESKCATNSTYNARITSKTSNESSQSSHAS